MKTRHFTHTELLRTAYTGYIRKPAQPRLHDYLQAIASARHTGSGLGFGDGSFTGGRRRKAPDAAYAEPLLFH
ncbi:MAG: hypothetical protein U0350_08455 [Caldilineaceae bacterium]